MSQEGGVDFSLPFGAAYEPQSQACFPSFLHMRSPTYHNFSLPKNSPRMTTPALPLHRFHIRTLHNMRNSAVPPPRRHRLLLRPKCPITQELLHSRNHLSLYKYKRLNILHLKRLTANILFRLNNSNRQVVSALARNTLKLAM
jgi:hypothetical protein